MRRLSLGLVLAAVMLISLVLLVFSYSEVGITCEIGSDGIPPAVSDLSAVPQSVVEDATRLATELFGDCQDKVDDFVNQLLATYLEAKDKDFVIVFNPGGWGWNLVETSPGWRSIFIGIKSELGSSGYKALLLDHLRTVDSLQGRLSELVEMITRYPSKAKDLASRVEFLTNHIPDLRVIVAGESSGTVISARVMTLLEDNPRVYSIQTGPPFWHKNNMWDRTLLLTGNGIIPDAFTEGDFLAVVKGYVKALFGLSEPINDFGTIPHYVSAPGHDYWWHYPEVYSQILEFIDNNFGVKWR